MAEACLATGAETSVVEIQQGIACCQFICLSFKENETKICIDMETTDNNWCIRFYQNSDSDRHGDKKKANRRSQFQPPVSYETRST